MSIDTPSLCRDFIMYKVHREPNYQRWIAGELPNYPEAISVREGAWCAVRLITGFSCFL